MEELLKQLSAKHKEIALKAVEEQMKILIEDLVLVVDSYVQGTENKYDELVWGAGKDVAKEMLLKLADSIHKG
jgi:polyhydroxyalkanoate synthesis regulator phasin